MYVIWMYSLYLMKCVEEVLCLINCMCTEKKKYVCFIFIKYMCTIFNNNSLKMYIIYTGSRFCTLCKPSEAIWRTSAAVGPCKKSPIANSGQLWSYDIFRTRSNRPAQLHPIDVARKSVEAQHCMCFDEKLWIQSTDKHGISCLSGLLIHCFRWNKCNFDILPNFRKSSIDKQKWQRVAITN